MKSEKIKKLTNDQIQEITKEIVVSNMHVRTKKKNFLIDLIVEANDISRK